VEKTVWSCSLSMSVYLVAGLGAVRVSRTRAAAVLSGVGEGALFDEPGVHPKILYLRRRMTTEEMKRLGGTG
jgi:hypothetical protein